VVAAAVQQARRPQQRPVPVVLLDVPAEAQRRPAAVADSVKAAARTRGSIAASTIAASPAGSQGR
jgi:hypothetical protein